MSGRVLLRSISSRAYEAAQARPELVDALLFTGFPDWALTVPPEADESPAAIIQRSRAHDARREVARIEAMLAECGLGSDDIGAPSEFDESWAFLVHPFETGDAVVDAFVAGAESTGDDRGYGPASIFSPNAVARLDDDLRNLDLAHVELVLANFGHEASLTESGEVVGHTLMKARAEGRGLVGSM
jgi:hypothetical protein